MQNITKSVNCHITLCKVNYSNKSLLDDFGACFLFGLLSLLGHWDTRE